MPIALTGEVGTNDITAPDWATLTAPTNGDDVDAPVVISAVQRLLNNDADLADFAVGTYAQTNATLTSTGIGLIRNVTSIANLKAVSTTGLPDASVVVVKDPTVTGNVISRLGLFVYDATSVLPECVIPAAVDGYLVVVPNSGIGRWLNVAIGLGWDGFTAEFQPKPRERVVRWQITGAGPTITTTSLTTAAWTQISPVVAPVLALNDDFDFDIDFSTGPVSAADNYVFFRVDVSYNGGSFTPVTGAKKTISTSSTNVLDWQSVHIGGRITASLGAGTYTLRVFGRCGTVNADTFIAGEWVARGIQYVAL